MASGNMDLIGGTRASPEVTYAGAALSATVKIGGQEYTIAPS